MKRRVIFIGAAGEMCRIAVERFAKVDGDWELVLCDIRPDLLTPLIDKLPKGLATSKKLDLYDHQNLVSTIRGATLVILGAGPYIRTAEPVMEACIEAGVPYLDFDDDVESTEHALSLNDKAKQAGIPIYIGCGASPGHSNILAVDAANDLDVVKAIDICWLVGEERPIVGRAVLEHMLHISAGTCVTWDNGQRVERPSFVQTERFPILDGEADQLLYETAHPEPVTLPRKYPDAERIRCFGGLDPAPMNGLFNGLALAVQDNKISQVKAVDFLFDAATGGIGRPLRGWRYALGGMLSQVRRNEMTGRALAEYLGKTLIGKLYPFKGGLLVTVSGTKNGKPAKSTRRSRLSHDYEFCSMGQATGTPCAAMAVLAIEETEPRTGVLSPEDWVDPPKYYQALERVGIPRKEIVETV